jgi:hypothetical protein
MTKKINLKKPIPIEPEYIWKNVPEILYEAPSYPGAKTSPIPYIDVPKDKKMPPVLFLFESKETGEFEIGDKGMPEPIIEQIPHRYVDLNFLFERFEKIEMPEMKDNIRMMLGMEKEAIAKKLGEEKVSKILDNKDLINNVTNESKSSQLERISAIKEQIQKQLREQK